MSTGTVRWANEEHRVTPSVLQPRTGWAMGSAGIIRELLRFSRATAGADPSYAVTWPDHHPAGPPCPVTGPIPPGPGTAVPVRVSQHQQQDPGRGGRTRALPAASVVCAGARAGPRAVHATEASRARLGHRLAEPGICLGAAPGHFSDRRVASGVAAKMPSPVL